MTASDHAVVDLFRVIDAMDVPTLVKAFAEDGSFRFGNSEPVVGRTPPLPVTNTLRLDGDRIADYRVFIDPGPLFAPQA